ncbi:MAG TPA: helicase [Candidatus Portnoybacteria bacterium]|nr:helicase [Candidatus Portnoybacteria bacterium]
MGILKAGRNVFLTGSAGTGKTYLLNQYIAYLKERGVKPAIVAPTGIAASHLGGITIHSFFGIGIIETVSDEYLKQLYYRRFLHNRFKKLQTLIIDEVSMVSPGLFISMDKILRTFKHSSKPFGGIQLILSGDFFQLPPISSNGESERFAWQTDLWEKSNLKVCYLEEKFRQDDPILINILDEIRANNVSEKSINIFHTCYRKKLSEKFQATRLYTHNLDVNRINENELNKLPSSPKIFQSRNKGSRKNIEKIFNSSLVQEKLKLKKGAAVIFIKNNFEKGYINGTLGQLVNFTKENLPVVETFSGRRIVVEPENWLMEDDQENIKASVKQIPLRLAWALTVHKSQGMTLDAAEIDLSKTFEVGQGYVALSRIKSIDGLYLMGLNETALQVDERVLVFDKKMQEFSALNASKWQSFSQEEIEIMQKEFILSIGGTINKKEIEKHKKEIINEKKKRKEFFSQNKTQPSKNYGTLNITKNLLAKKKNIAEIADIRGLSEGTIIGHIQKMIKLGLDVEKDHLKPKEKILKAVAQAISEIKKRNNPDDFLESGQIRLRAIFEKLNQEVSYNDIHLALLFLKS